MKKVFKVETYMELLFCDKCGKQMKEQSHCYLTSPMQFVYKCECGEEKLLNYSIPRISYRIKEEYKEEIFIEENKFQGGKNETI